MDCRPYSHRRQTPANGGTCTLAMRRCMRPSECIALRVGDIDLKSGTISITKSRNLGEERAPKTSASRRTINLLPNVVKVLQVAKELRVTEDDYFFKNRRRGPIDADQWRKDYWY